MSAATIIIILDVLFIVLLLVGFFQGFCRGVKRSSLELVLTILGVVGAGLLTPVITNAILGISVGNGQTLKQYFIDLIAQDATIGALVDSSPNLAEFLESLPQVLFCAIIFLLLNLVMRLVIYIIYKIISAIAFKSKKKEKQLGLKRNRWVGAAIGTLKMFILSLVICMPLTSLVKLADNALTTVSAATAESSTQDEPTQEVVPETVTEVLSGVNSSFFGALNGAVGLDDFIFDDISKFQIEGQNVYLRQDLSNYLSIYDSVMSVASSDMTKFTDLDWEAIDEIYNKATEGTLYNVVVLNVVADFVDNFETLQTVIPEIADYSALLSEVRTGMNASDNRTEYFKNDIDKIYSIFSSVAQTGFIDEITSSDDLELTVANFANNQTLVATKALEDLTALNILHDGFEPAIDILMQNVNNADVEEIAADLNTSISNWSAFGDQLASALTNFGELSNLLRAQNSSITDVAGDFASILSVIETSVEPIFEKAGQLLDIVDNLEIAKTTNGEKLLPQVLEMVGIENGNILDVKGENISNYEQFFEYISAPVRTVISTGVYSSIQNGLDMNEVVKTLASSITLTVEGDTRVYSTTLSDIILPLYKITALHDLVFSEVISQSASTGIVDLSLLEEAGYDTNFDACYADWEAELPLISQVIYELNTRNFDETQTMLDYLLSGGDINEVIKQLDDETVDLVVPPIMQAKSLKPLRDEISTSVLDNLRDVIDPSISVSLDLNSATYDPASPEDQSQEISNIVKALIAILKQGDLTTLENMDQSLLGELLEEVKLNAYRVELSGKTEVGVFRSVFDALIQQAESEFEVSFTKVFSVTHIYEVDFTEVFTLIELASDTENAFANAFKDIVISGNETTAGKIEELVGAVEDNQELVEQVLDITDRYEISIKLPQDQKDAAEQKLAEIEDTVSADIIDSLRNLLGLGVSANA